MEKVYPYKKILPKELREDLLKTFLSLLDPDTKPNDRSKLRMIEEMNKNIDSKIITYQHAELISKWIDKLEIRDMINNFYEFKLLFRGSRDGLSRDKFHEFCDNQSRTVSIVKMKDSNEILGGYNPVEWNDYSGFGNWCTTKDSFIFSFKDDNRIENYILSRVKDAEHAIFNSYFYGPKFGRGDLAIWGMSKVIESKKSSYEKSIIETNKEEVTIEECEVFQVI
jgi:hypothetical protein